MGEVNLILRGGKNDKEHYEYSSAEDNPDDIELSYNGITDNVHYFRTIRVIDNFGDFCNYKYNILGNELFI